MKVCARLSVRALALLALLVLPWLSTVHGDDRQIDTDTRLATGMRRAFVQSDRLSKSKAGGRRVLVLLDFALDQAEHQCLQRKHDRLSLAACKHRNPHQAWVRYPDGSLCSATHTPKACVSSDASRDRIALVSVSHPSSWTVNPSGQLVLQENITIESAIRCLRYSYTSRELRLQLCHSRTQEQTNVAFGEWQESHVTLLGFDPSVVAVRLAPDDLAATENIFELSEQYSRPNSNTSVVKVVLRVHVQASVTPSLPFCARRGRSHTVVAGSFSC
jgi:hypothetical protein